MRLVGKYTTQVLRWGEMQERITALRKAVEARDEKIKDLATRLYRTTAELNRLRNHHERLGIDER